MAVRPGRDHRNRLVDELLDEAEEEVVEIVQRCLDRPAGKLVLFWTALNTRRAQICPMRGTIGRTRIIHAASGRTKRLRRGAAEELEIPLAPVALDRLVGVEREKDTSASVPPQRGELDAVLVAMGPRGATRRRAPRATA